MTNIMKKYTDEGLVIQSYEELFKEEIAEELEAQMTRDQLHIKFLEDAIEEEAIEEYWIDPAGGYHDWDETDPAKMYE